MKWHRFLSGLVGVISLLISYTDEGIEETLSVMMWLVLPLTCIWFGDLLGDYTGMARLHLITCKSPGWLVRFCGWVLLLIPMVVGPLVAFLKG